MISLNLISSHARKKPDESAIVDVERRMSWAQFECETKKRVDFLLETYDDCLPRQATYITANRLDLVPWLAAFNTLGIPCAGLDYTLPVSSLRELNNSIEADFVLVSTAKAPNLSDPVMYLPRNAKSLDLDDPMSARDIYFAAEMAMNRPSPRPIVSRNVRLIGFTSGTTGLPKIVQRRESFDQRRFEYFTRKYRFSDADKFLAIMPTYHAAGNGWMRMFLSLGACVYICSANDEVDWQKMLSEAGITASVMTPVLLSRLLGRATVLRDKIAPHLRWLLVGGRHLTPDLKLRATKILGPYIFEYYGTTETGVNTVAEPEDMTKNPCSVGKCIEGNTIRIIDTDGEVLPERTVGRIAVNSYMNMACYGDGTAPALLIEGERFLLTQDKGYMDKEGNLYLVNRSEASENRVNLYSLEDAIRILPCVSDVAILTKIANEGEETTCALAIKDGHQPSQRLFEQIFSLAAKENVTLDCIRVLSAIPYTPSGKIRMHDLIPVDRALA